MSINDALEGCSECCTVFSDAIRNIIQRSIRGNFRQRCFELLEVNNSFEAGEKVKKKLTKLKSRKRITNHDQKNVYCEKTRRIEDPNFNNIEVDPTAVSTNANSTYQDEASHSWVLSEINTRDIDDW